MPAPTKATAAQAVEQPYPDFEIRICDSSPPVGKPADVERVRDLMDQLGVKSSDLLKRPPLDADFIKRLFVIQTEAEYIAQVRKAHKLGPDVMSLTAPCERCGRKEEQAIGFCKCLPTFYDCNPEFPDSDGRVFDPNTGKVVARGQRCVCWANVHNRDLDRSWMLTITQEILNGVWAGPLTIKGGGINPTSSITVGKTGSVQDGQHKGLGLYCADQLWRAYPKMFPFWKTAPVLEGLWIFGASEHPKMLRTMDYTRPRTIAQNDYRSEIFDNPPFKKKSEPVLVPKDRKELSRILQSAKKLLWDRTRHPGYMTPSDASEFQERHPRLLDCVKVMHDLDTVNGRAVSDLRLNSGYCAGILYLMGSSKSDDAAYRHADVRHEKHLSWDNWDEALRFWKVLTSSTKESGDLSPVRCALDDLRANPSGQDGTNEQKHEILARAWLLFAAGKPVTYKARKDDAKNLLSAEGALALRYAMDAAGDMVLEDRHNFGGIDLGEDYRAFEKAATDDEAADNIKKAEADRKKAIEEKAKELRAAQGPSPTVVAEPGSGGDGKPGKPPAPVLKPTDTNGGPKLAPKVNGKVEPAKAAPSVIEQYRTLKESHKGYLLLVRTTRGGFAFDADAEQLGKLFKLEPKKNNDGVVRIEFPITQFAVRCGQLRNAKRKFVVADETEGNLQLQPKQ